MSDRERTVLQALGGDEFEPIALLAWKGEYDDAGSLLTRDAARIRDLLSKSWVPWGSYSRAEFPDGIEGVRVWTAEKVVAVHNHDDGHSFEIFPRNPPAEADHEWGA